MTQREHPLRNTYDLMKRRCFQVGNSKWHRYGGRGITVCSRWLGSDGFANFVADMGPRPTGMSLDRINNDGNYEPDNCRWATALEQAASATPGGARGVKNPLAKLTDDLVRISRRRVALGGKIKTIARELGVDRKTLRNAITGQTWRHVS